MPRQGHWVIIIASTPTAFRARQPEQLLPTLKQLQRTQKDAAMRWFDGRRFWASPAEAEHAERERSKAPKRPRSWRPGGEHRDPRDQYKQTRDQKRARFKQRLRRQNEEGQRPEGRGQNGRRPPRSSGVPDGKGRPRRPPAGRKPGKGFKPK
ncbi:MAG TPA: hypothetical protein VMM93_04535 [Vicinamibacterales bacterium]|nr:hypothetical protein [Vicinamibacterales bacterium]